MHVDPNMHWSQEIAVIIDILSTENKRSNYD